MKNTITAIETKGFRGINDLKVSLPEKLTIITGKNGTGKTSLLAAIPFALGENASASDITIGKEFAGVNITLSDGTTIARKRTSSKSTTWVNRKAVTNKIARDYIFDVLGISKDSSIVFDADFFDALSDKDISQALLKILPGNVTKDSFLQLTEEVNGVPLTEAQKNVIGEIYADGKATVSLADIENLYKESYAERRNENRLVDTYRKRTAIPVSKPASSRDVLQKTIDSENEKTAKFAAYKTACAQYDTELKRYEASKKKAEEIQLKLKEYADCQETDPEKIKQLEYRQKELSRQRDEQTVGLSSVNAAISSLKNVIAELDSPVCPISKKLTCTTDKTAVKGELLEAIHQNEESIALFKKTIENIDREIEKIRKAISDAQKNAVKATQKKALEDTLKEINSLECPRKPKAVAEPNDAIIKNTFREMEEYSKYEAYAKDVAYLKSELEKLELLEFKVKIFGTEGVSQKVLDKAKQKISDICNNKADIVELPVHIEFTKNGGVNVVKTTNTGNTVSIPLDSCSAGEFVMASYLLISAIAKISGTSILMLDNLDRLDSDNAKALLGYLVKDTDFSSVFAAGVDHEDFIASVKSLNANFITMK